MKIKKSFLNFFILLIGVIIISPLFFSTPVHAETGVANVYYNEVVDSIELVNIYGQGNGSINVSPSTGQGVYDNIEGYYTYRYYTHYDVTITTDNEYASGSTTVNGQRVTFSGKYTYVSVKGRTGTYTIDEDNSSTPPSSSALSLSSYAYSVNYTYNIPQSTAEKIIYRDIPGTIDFKYSSDLENWTSPFGVSHKTGYYKIGTFNFIDSNNDQSMFQGIFRLDLPIANIQNIPFPEFYKLSSDGNVYPIVINYYWVSYGRFDTVIYFVINDTYTLQPLQTDTILIKYPVDTGWCYDVPLKFQYLPYDDEQYIPLYEFIQNQGQSTTTIEVDNKNDSFSSASDQMIQLEDQLQGDFNSAIGSIDIPSNPFNDFGIAFGNSSRFLVHMFDQLTIHNNSPFATVITFSLILGLAMLMIGKKGN